MEHSLKESKQKLIDIEKQQIKLDALSMSHDQIESLVNQRIAKREEEVRIEELKKKTLNLKIKANKGSTIEAGSKNFWESADDEKAKKDKDDAMKAELNQMKLEVIQELRDAKNTQIETNKIYEESMENMRTDLKEIVNQLKVMNSQKQEVVAQP